MAKAKGSIKTGGRKKGTVNKSTQSVLDKLQALGCDPIEALFHLGKDALEDDDKELAFKCYKELASYYAPKLKSVEHSTDPDNPISVVASVTFVGK